MDLLYFPLLIISVLSIHSIFSSRFVDFTLVALISFVYTCSTYNTPLPMILIMVEISGMEIRKGKKLPK